MISTLSELCDGFIADRFQSTIFPHMSKLFESLLHIVGTSSDNEKEKDETRYNNIRIKNEDENILNSLLDCVSRVFSANGVYLASMVSIVGSIIVPFIALDGTVGDSAMDAMKALVKVDSDCLWRTLMKMSGRDIPKRPLLPVNNRVSHPVVESRLSKRCLEIVHFINDLPEQNILLY